MGDRVWLIAVSFSAVPDTGIIPRPDSGGQMSCVNPASGAARQGDGCTHRAAPHVPAETSPRAPREVSHDAMITSEAASW
jgi:hypothetical protein